MMVTFVSVVVFVYLRLAIMGGGVNLGVLFHWFTGYSCCSLFVLSYIQKSVFFVFCKAGGEAYCLEAKKKTKEREKLAN